MQPAKSPWYISGITLAELITIERTTCFAHSPWLYISCRNPKRTVSLSKVQPPFALKLHQTLSKHNPVDLTLGLLWCTGPEERSFQPSDWPICKLRLICSSNNRIFDAGVDSWSKRSRGINEHLAHRVLTLRIADSARCHCIVNEQPSVVASFDWRWAGFEESVLPRMHWCGERLCSGQSSPVEEIGRGSVVER